MDISDINIEELDIESNEELELGSNKDLKIDSNQDYKLESNKKIEEQSNEESKENIKKQSKVDPNEESKENLKKEVPSIHNLLSIFDNFQRIWSIFKKENEYCKQYSIICKEDSMYTKNGARKRIVEIEIFSLSAKIIFEEISEANPWTICLTSGTLCPFKSIEQETQMNFPVKFIGKHIIDNEDQVIKKK